MVIANYWSRLYSLPVVRRKPFAFLYRIVAYYLAYLQKRYVSYEDAGRDIRYLFRPGGLGSGSAGLFLSRRQYEPAYEYLESLIQPGDIVIDCGANIGAYSIAAGGLVGEDGLVISVEPQEYALRAIRRSIAASGLSNVRIIKAAISSQTGIAELDVSRTSVEASIVWHSENPCLIKVPKITLDVILNKYQMDHVNLVKLDVEGAEYDALCGGEELLSRFTPDILLEVWDGDSESTRKCEEFLRKRNYAFYQFGPQGELVKMQGLRDRYPTVLARHRSNS